MAISQTVGSRILNLATLSSAILQEKPWPWAAYEGVFDKDTMPTDFPTSNFEYHIERRLLEGLGKQGSEAWYHHNVQTRPLLELGKDEPHEPGGLSNAWLQVAAELASPEYRDCISDVVQHDVRGLRMQAHFWLYGEGSVFRPHVDKAHKMVTHLMYLTDGWTPSMGGCLQILGSADANDVRASLPPRMNTAVLLKRTAEAWHSVSLTPMGVGGGGGRRVLQVWFWQD